MSESPLDTKIDVAFFKTARDTGVKHERMTLRRLADIIVETSAETKKDLPLAKLGRFGKHLGDHKALRNDDNLLSISGIEADYDGEKISAKQAADILRSAGIAGIIHTSPSHRKSAPRWRIYCPLSEPYDASDRTIFVAELNGAFSGALGSESFTLSRAYYYGSVLGGHHVEVFEVDGEFIDKVPDLHLDAMMADGRHPDDEPEEVEAYEVIDLEEAQKLFDEDLESGRIDSVLAFLLKYRRAIEIDDAQCREEYWRDVCWALHHGSGGDKRGFKIWQEYAEQTVRAERLAGRRESVKAAIRSEWKTAKDERAKGVLGLGTIYARAREAGWHPDAIDASHFTWDQIDASDFTGDDDEDEDEDVVASDFTGDDEDDDLDEEVPRTEPAIADRVVRKSEASKCVPSHLLTIPGVLGEGVRYFNASSRQNQPQFAVQTALALGSVVLGRRWVTNLNNYTALYLVVLGVTGCGKESCRDFIEDVLTAADLGNLIGPPRSVSEAGMMHALNMKPRHITVTDELGMILAANKSSTNSNYKDAQRLLISAFGQAHGRIRPNAYSANRKSKEEIEAQNKMIIERPSITMLGMSTPETFFDAMSYDDVTNGFLNRLLVVNSLEPRRVDDEKEFVKPPAKLLRWVQKYGRSESVPFERSDDADVRVPGDDPRDVEDPHIIRFTAAAKYRLREIAQYVVDRQDELDGRKLAHLWSRAKEIAQRISLIVALSDEANAIDVKHLDWAWDYVRFYVDQMVEAAHGRIGVGKFVHLADVIAEKVMGADKRGIAVRDMIRSSTEFKNMNEREREEIFYRLVNDYAISKVSVPPGRQGGRPTARFVATKYLKP